APPPQGPGSGAITSRQARPPTKPKPRYRLATASVDDPNRSQRSDPWIEPDRQSVGRGDAVTAPGLKFVSGRTSDVPRAPDLSASVDPRRQGQHRHSQRATT